MICARLIDKFVKKKKSNNITNFEDETFCNFTQLLLNFTNQIYFHAHQNRLLSNCNIFVYFFITEITDFEVHRMIADTKTQLPLN